MALAITIRVKLAGRSMNRFAQESRREHNLENDVTQLTYELGGPKR